MIYLLRDLLRITDAETRGGRSIVTVFVAAVAINAVIGFLRRSPNAHAARKLPAVGLTARCVGSVTLGGIAGRRCET